MRLPVFSGAPGGTRTPDTRFRKPLLYPPELRAPVATRCKMQELLLPGKPRQKTVHLLFVRYTVSGKIQYIRAYMCLCVSLSFLTGVPGGTRTPNLLIRSQMLYPIELQAHDNSTLNTGKRNCTKGGLKSQDRGFGQIQENGVLHSTPTVYWRRARDSNPRDSFITVYSLSRRAPSTYSASSPRKYSQTGGGSGIRTHGTGKRPNGFQDRLLKPLGHPSRLCPMQIKV